MNCRTAYLTRMHRYTMTVLVGKITSCFQPLISKGKVVAVFSVGCEWEHLGRQAQETDTTRQLRLVNSTAQPTCSVHSTANLSFVFVMTMKWLTSIIVRRSLTFIKARPFGSSIPSSSILAIRHVREQKTLSGFCDRKTVFRHAYPSRPVVSASHPIVCQEEGTPLKLVVFLGTSGITYSTLA